VTYRSWIRTLALAAVLAMQIPSATADPQVGWWWNPAESGRGFFIENKDGIIYLAGYFYENDGRAKWLVAGGPIADPYAYDGRLLAYSGGQTLFGAYVPPAAPVDAGAVSLRFSDDTHAVLTWPGGAIPIEREVFDTKSAPFQPVNGWWWNDTESGRGYSVEVRGDSAFVVAFMYDAAGQPVWYFSAGPMSSPTVYEGEWLQFANGQTLLGSYHPPSAPVSVGRLSLEFDAEDEVTASWSDEASSGAGMRKGRTVVKLAPEFKKRYVPPMVPIAHPDRLDGTFTQTQTIQGPVTMSNGALGTLKSTLIVTGNATWTIPESDLASLNSVTYTLPTILANLQPVNDTVLATYTFHTQGGGETCDGGFVKQPIPVTWGAATQLKVDAFGAFDGMLQSDPLTGVAFKVTCVLPTRVPPVMVDDDEVGAGHVVSILIKGQNQVYAINCKNPVATIPAGSVTYRYSNQCSFAGVHQ
jgi:hypothetical protein